MLVISLIWTLGACKALSPIANNQATSDDKKEEVLSSIEKADSSNTEETLSDTVDSESPKHPKHESFVHIDTLFVLEKTKCFDSCPSYSLTFLSNGKVYLEAIDNLFIQGCYQCNIEDKKMDAIMELSNKFMDTSFETEYPIDGIFLEGLPKSILISQTKDTKKTVVCQYDCPDEIVHLAQYLEQIIPTLDWIKIRL